MPETKDPRGMYEAPAIDAPSKASQTLLNRMSTCPFSARLYLEHKGGPQSAAMQRGELIHATIEAVIQLAIETGETAVPAEVGKDYLQAILDERVDLALPPAEVDACRAAIWNWCSDFRLEPETIVGVETMLEAEVAGQPVRGKIDLALIANGEAHVYDWKSSLSYPSQEAHDNDHQMLFYGLLMLEGIPEGETVPLGKRLAGVHLNAVFPRIVGDDGRMFTRHSYVDRGQVHDFRRILESSLAKLGHGLKTGMWKAAPGSQCSTCAAPHRCPIPAQDMPLTIATPGQAVETGERIIVLEGELKALKKNAKAWVEEEAPIVVGDQEFVLVATETESPRSKEEVKAAIRQGGLDPDDYYKTTRGMRFKRVKRATMEGAK